jgi:hypothetical protein
LSESTPPPYRQVTGRGRTARTPRRSERDLSMRSWPSRRLPGCRSCTRRCPSSRRPRPRARSSRPAHRPRTGPPGARCDREFVDAARGPTRRLARAIDEIRCAPNRGTRDRSATAPRRPTSVTSRRPAAVAQPAPSGPRWLLPAHGSRVKVTPSIRLCSRRYWSSGRRIRSAAVPVGGRAAYPNASPSLSTLARL